MSNPIGFRLNNNDGQPKRRPKPGVILEFEETEDAEEQIGAAFEMLLGKRAADDRPKDDSEPGPGTQLPLF